jgi:hypothetical protein
MTLRDSSGKGPSKERHFVRCEQIGKRNAPSEISDTLKNRQNTTGCRFKRQPGGQNHPPHGDSFNL